LFAAEMRWPCATTAPPISHIILHTHSAQSEGVMLRGCPTADIKRQNTQLETNYRITSGKLFKAAAHSDERRTDGELCHVQVTDAQAQPPKLSSGGGVFTYRCALYKQSTSKEGWETITFQSVSHADFVFFLTT
jgi:hypothetical protein